MSFFYLGKTKEGRTLVVDTDDMVTESFSEKDVERIKALKIPVNPFNISTANIGLERSDNKYAIYIDGWDRPIYKGEFPTSCRRNDITSFDIKLTTVGIYKGYIYFGVVCNCWVKYDIEVPMVMCHVVSTDVKALSCTSSMAVYTNEPVYFSKESFYKMQRKQCFDDFPDFYVDQDKASIKVSKQGINVFGVVFKDRPIYEQLDLKLH